jgi:hypothetical protein
LPDGQQTPFETELPAGHTQAPPPQVGVGWAQATLLPQLIPHVALAFRFVSQPSFDPPQSPQPGVHALVPQTPAEQVGAAFAEEQTTVAQVVPQLPGVLMVSSHPSESRPLQSSFPAGQAEQAPPAQIWLVAHATALPHCPALPHVCTPPEPVGEHRLVPGEQTPAHVLPTQADAAQSVSTVQPPPTAQSFGHEPPQSTSVSVPFRTESLQLALAQVPPEHLPLAGSAQSEFALQPLPTAHVDGQPPPQSVSGSGPFLTPSVHVGVAHLPPVHLPLAGSAQSLSSAHDKPAPQGLQLPPQSLSVSSPFRTESPQPAATHWPALHRYGQAVPSVHVPAALQVWGMVVEPPLHCFVVAPMGSHSPAQAPPVQTNGHVSIAFDVTRSTPHSRRSFCPWQNVSPATLPTHAAMTG